MGADARRYGLRFAAATAAWLACAAASYVVLDSASAAASSRVEAVRRAFPSVAARLDRRAAVKTVTWNDRGGPVTGFRLQLRAAQLQASTTPASALREPVRVSLPRLASDPLVAEGEGVRVVRRPLAEATTPAENDDGRLVYAEAWPGTDVFQTAGPAWTEEFLHLSAPFAPREFEYEVETTGAATVTIEDGDVRFLGATGHGLVLSRPVVVDAIGRRSATAARWELGPPDQAGARRLTLRLDPTGLDYPLLIDPVWITTGSLNTAKSQSIGILLHNGKVLAMAGAPNSQNTSELYDPATGIWTPVGNVGEGHAVAAAVLLHDGRVLLIGGSNAGGPTASCRFFDPQTNTWSLAPTMNQSRMEHTATLLADGRVLVAGGDSPINNPLKSAEIFDPVANSWTPTGTMVFAHRSHGAVRLPDGKVLVAGGVTLPGPSTTRVSEVYDPGTGAWTRVGDLGVARDTYSLTLLPDGTALAAGGCCYLATAEVYNPGTGLWTATGGLAGGRAFQSATLLPGGRVVVAGGGNGSVLSSTELHSYSSGTWSSGPAMNFGRFEHAATMLPDGRVLVAGGQNGPVLTTAELLDIDAPSWTGASNMTTSRSEATATRLQDGRILVVGGVSSNTAEVYDPSTGNWTPTANNLSVQRWRHTATLLVDGRVLVAGSVVSAIDGNTAEIYDPATNRWTPTGSMSTYRYWHSATLLPCGEVLVTGGSQADGYTSAERYNPRTGQWRLTASMSAPGRWAHTATLLPDGRVLVTGGWGSGAPLTTAELYDPVGETWTATAGSMTNGRYHHRATLLPNGRVLVTAGSFSNTTSDLFDPASRTFAATGGLTAGHDSDFTATLLPNGRVLVLGGFLNPSRAEVYDPAVGVWTAMPNTTAPRDKSAAALLPDGRVLVAGGSTASAEIFDVGRGEDPAWRPVLNTVTDPLVTGTALTAAGTGFQGLGEGSTGLSYMHSATNYPLVQLRRLDNDQVRWLPVDPAAGWSGTSFRSLPVSGWSPGPAIATVFTNGIPSASKPLSVECPPAVIATHPANQAVCTGSPATLVVGVETSFCEAYQWYKDASPVVDDAVFTGATTSALHMSTATAGTYRATVSLSCSRVTTDSVDALITVEPNLSNVTISMPTGTSVCSTCLGGTATESHTGGGVVSQQWGYRTTSGGPITPFVGRTGPSYTLNGNDFPGPGNYFLVVTVTPTCGGALVSNEIPVAVTSGTTSGDVLFLTVTSRDQENVLEWINPPANGTVSVKFTGSSTTCAPPMTEAAGTPLPGFPAAATANTPERVVHTLTGLNGNQYCYSIFYDAGSGYGSGRSNSGRPFDTSGDVKWAFSTGTFSTTPPSITAAGVVATNNGAVVNAMQRGTAGGEWPTGWLPALLGGPAQERSPIVPITVSTSNPVLFLGAQDGAVYALDGARGGAVAPPWPATAIAGVVQAAPAGIFTAFSGFHDYLLVGTRDDAADNAMVALDPFDGHEITRFTNGGGPTSIGIVNSMAAVEYGTRRVYFTSHPRSGGSPDTLWALGLDTSPNPVFSYAWSRNLGTVDASPVLRGGRLYASSAAGGGTLYSIDAASGALAMDRTLGLFSDGPARGFVFPDRESDDLYFATGTRVWVVTDAAGVLSPKFPPVTLGVGVTPSIVLFSPALGRVYVGGSDGRLYELDVSGPSIAAKSVALGDSLSVVGAPSLDLENDLVHVGTEAGIFYAVRVPLTAPACVSDCAGQPIGTACYAGDLSQCSARSCDGTGACLP